MELEFNDYGNLEGGIVKVTDLKNIETSLVDAFPETETRSRIFSKFKIFLENIIDWEVITRVWLDGSFCSDNLDPRDIDCVLFHIPTEEYQSEIVKLKNSKPTIKDEYFVDFYTIPDKKYLLSNQDFELSQPELINTYR